MNFRATAAIRALECLLGTLLSFLRSDPGPLVCRSRTSAMFVRWAKRNGRALARSPRTAGRAHGYTCLVGRSSLTASKQRDCRRKQIQEVIEGFRRENDRLAARCDALLQGIADLFRVEKHAGSGKTEAAATRKRTLANE